jgi:hypothetical protein
MKRRFISSAAVLVMTLGLGGVAQPAQATEVLTCANAIETWAFNPPLNPTIQAGIVKVTYGGACFAADTGGGSGLKPPGGSTSFNYSGSCVTASLSNATTSGVLIGGSLAIVTGPGGTSVNVLVPVIPCDESTAIGAGVFAGTF